MYPVGFNRQMPNNIKNGQIINIDSQNNAMNRVERSIKTVVLVSDGTRKFILPGSEYESYIVSVDGELVYHEWTKNAESTVIYLSPYPEYNHDPIIPEKTMWALLRNEILPEGRERPFRFIIIQFDTRYNMDLYSTELNEYLRDKMNLSIFFNNELFD